MAKLSKSIVILGAKRTAFGTMSGTLKGQIGNLRLAGNLAAHNSDLRKSISCMTGNRILSSGTSGMRIMRSKVSIRNTHGWMS